MGEGVRVWRELWPLPACFEGAPSLSRAPPSVLWGSVRAWRSPGGVAQQTSGQSSSLRWGHTRRLVARRAVCLCVHRRPLWRAFRVWWPVLGPVTSRPACTLAGFRSSGQFSSGPPVPWPLALIQEVWPALESSSRCPDYLSGLSPGAAREGTCLRQHARDGAVCVVACWTHVGNSVACTGVCSVPLAGATAPSLNPKP